MKNWFNKYYKTIIITSFLIPIITIAIVSISHVTKWYEISNPIVWSQYLSFGIEIAALSALAAISTNIGNKVYFPFILVTLIQFIGNVFYSYLYIDIKSNSFLSWVELVSPILNIIGIEPTDLISHRMFLSFMEGGILPIISLSFLHMLVLYAEDIKTNNKDLDKEIINNIEIYDDVDDKKTDVDETISDVDETISDVNETKSDVNETKYNQNYIKVPSYFLNKKISEENKNDETENYRIKASLANRILNRHK